jgi:predicted transcriptional regulator
MPKMKQIAIRLSSTQLRALEQLAKKLQIDRANVIRLAISKLSESEGISTTHRG